MGVIIPPPPKKRKVSPKKLKPTPRQERGYMRDEVNKQFLIYLVWGLFYTLIFSGVTIFITALL